MVKVGICCDHRGIYLKNILIEYLEHAGYEVINFGTDDGDSVDFPEFAFKLGDALVKRKVNMGISICGTGIGMSIALNKVKGVYCAKVGNISEAFLCREHNNANCIAINADMDDDQAKAIVDKFLVTEFSTEVKYSRRNKMIKDREKNG